MPEGVAISASLAVRSKGMGSQDSQIVRSLFVFLFWIGLQALTMGTPFASTPVTPDLDLCLLAQAVEHAEVYNADWTYLPYAEATETDVVEESDEVSNRAERTCPDHRIHLVRTRMQRIQNVARVVTRFETPPPKVLKTRLELAFAARGPPQV